MKLKLSHIFLTIIFLTQPALSQTNFTITGELRSRVEGRDNADFNSERLDGTVFVLNRMRVGFSREWQNGIRVLVELQDSRLWGEEGSSLASLGAVDLHQAYVQIDKIAGLPVTAKLGRQELAFGNGRLVSNYAWHNVGRAYDAIQLSTGQEQQDLRVWLAQVRDFNAPTVRRSQVFSGAYFSTQKILSGTADLYLLNFFDNRNFNAFSLHDHGHDHGTSEEPEEQEGAGNGSSHLNIWTLGSRLRTTLFERLAVEIEGVYQFGNRASLDVRAFGIAVEGEYTFNNSIEPKINAGFTFGSGDSDDDDAKLETFSNLFPDAHAYLGKMDYASWSNISAYYFGATLRPAKTFEAGAKLYFFALADDHDAFYRAEGFRVGSPIETYRTAVPGAGTDVGREIDLFASLLYRDRIVVRLGLSRFFVGDFLENTGGLRADDSFFGYFSVTVNF